MTRAEDMPAIGWREWVSLPALQADWIKAKIDTGARTSSLHAYDLQYTKHRGEQHVRFEIHPFQRDNRHVILAEVPVHEVRSVRSSGGHTTTRPVILTPIRLFDREWDIELTLVARDEMGFRMLVGRQAIRGHMLVDPGRSYLGGRPPDSIRRRNAQASRRHRQASKRAQQSSPPQDPSQ
jgi:hypothetical protein